MTAALSRLPSALARGWRAELALGFTAVHGRTVLARRAHLGPLRVQRPFHPEGPEVCHVYIVHPPGGVVGGDRLAIEVAVEAGAHALLTTPASGKFYRSAGAESRVDVRLAVADDATLEWLPQDSIVFPGARARQRTVVQLGATARFIGWDVTCLGLPARGEGFDDGHLRLGFEVWRGDRPLLVDALRIDGGMAALASPSGFAGRAIVATWVAAPADAELLQQARNVLAESPAAGRADWGLSLVDGLLVGRALADAADVAMAGCTRLWQALRPLLTGRAALPPRIWAT